MAPALTALGAPIAFTLGASSLLYILIKGIPSISAMNYMANGVNGVNSFTLLAMSFFVMAGRLTNSGGTTARIFGFARAATVDRASAFDLLPSAQPLAALATEQLTTG